MEKIDKLQLKTEDLTNENVKALGELFPDILTEVEKEGKLIKTINVEKLKELVGDFADKDSEIYEMNWAGKQKARRIATQSTTQTLRPVVEDSVDFENTENLYIEGDNLEILKILRKSYSNSIKVIYIDPPYNTGKDFVYMDKFAMSMEDYEREAGAVDEEGNRLIKNIETDGRFHSNWLNMMYPRLQLAYKLLKKDGVIFISIDDKEVANLRKMCDEIFGVNNFVGQLVIQTATDNNETLINVEHEYVLVFAKTKSEQPYWSRKSEAAINIINKYTQLKETLKDNIIQIQIELRAWIKNNVKDLPKVTHYDNVDEKGVFHDGDIANTRFGGYVYEVIHPLTKKPCKIPAKGFRFPEPTLNKIIEDGNIMFGKDETTLIKPKIRIENVRDALRSIIYEDGRASTKMLDSLLARTIFDNPKSSTILQRFFDFTTEKDNDIILDFFSGSATTAHTVMQLNANDTGTRKYIMVQLDENLDDNFKIADQKAKKTIENAIKFLDSIDQPHLITEIGKERIRRAAKKIKEDNKDKDLSNVDFGFRVFKLDSSNMKDTYYNPGSIEQKTLLNFKDSIKDDRTEEDILYQVLLDMSIPISAKVELKTIKNKKVFVVSGGWLVACFDDDIDLELVKELAEIKSDINGLKTKFVFRESSFKDDSAMINAMEYLKIKVFKTDAELKSNVKVV